MESKASERFEGWCIVELMGHNVMAGYVTEQVVGGAAMLRVDVPAISEAQGAFTKFYAPAAVYGITPTTEENATIAARRIQARPVELWIVPTPQARPAQIADREQEELDMELMDEGDDDDDFNDSPF